MTCLQYTIALSKHSQSRRRNGTQKNEIRARVYQAGNALNPVPPCPASEENVKMYAKGLGQSHHQCFAINGPYGFSLWLLPFGASSCSQHTFLLCSVFYVLTLIQALPSQFHTKPFHRQPIENLTLLCSISTYRVFCGALEQYAIIPQFFFF